MGDVENPKRSVKPDVPTQYTSPAQDQKWRARDLVDIHPELLGTSERDRWQPGKRDSERHPNGQFLAVAFTDENGNRKYNPGKDALIAAVVDTNHDKVVSVVIRFSSAHILFT